ncbi:DUF4296 domain-containing protein [Flavobacterium agricola]|uniref:DUF4296 domain-containing protein n=1 Tax=Flavobacterium agricola TaxID=2870839 RepID=A0ABY6LY62_9FLAO|nr:DUF4296 domain-containing protein [Flavobacterium agricola]UYW01279.1 DUF4296 domain-containing protein [Flavobacterium agricola]
MKKVLFFNLIFLVLLSCEKNTAPKPEKLITEAELEEVLYEMAILQGAESQLRTTDNVLIDTYAYIQNRFGLDSLTIVQNNMYYSHDYKNYEKMNERIVKRLKKLQETTKPDEE